MTSAVGKATSASTHDTPVERVLELAAAGFDAALKLI